MWFRYSLKLGKIEPVGHFGIPLPRDRNEANQVIQEFKEVAGLQTGKNAALAIGVMEKIQDVCDYVQL